MDNTLVSSRISRVKKDAAVGVLSSLGATTSDLINKAFDYVLETGELPQARPRPRPSKEECGAFFAASTLDVPWEGAATDDCYKEALRGGKRADYESLA